MKKTIYPSTFKALSLAALPQKYLPLDSTIFFRKKTLLILILTLFFFSGKTQNFPYLNASTGNPDFFTDKDTNMFMVHGNRIAKLDKNFNPVWVKTYGSLSFKSILLTKTGSMYFIGGVNSLSLVGKIEANGNVGWMKSTSGMSLSVPGSTVSSATINCNSLFMSSANHLLLAGTISGPGNAALVKMDTLGNLLKARTFSLKGTSYYGFNVSSVNILNEGSGVMNLVSLGQPVCFECLASMIITFSYSDIADTVINTRELTLGWCTKCNLTFSLDFHRSKTRSDVYYLFGQAYIGTNQWNPVGIPDQARLGKFTMSGPLWSHGYRWSTAPATKGKAFDEDEKGNIFTVVDNLQSSHGGYYSGIVNFDSTGNYNGNWTKYFSGYSYGSSLYYSLDERANVIHHNRVFLNVVGGGFPANPVITETISPGFTWACSATNTITDMGTWAAPFSTDSIPQQFTVTSMSMASLSPTMNAVSGFSLSQNFCVYMAVTEEKLSEETIIYPNPAHDKLSIKNIGSDIMTLNLYNVTGTPVPVKINKSEIDLSDFPSGIYFLRIETSGGVLIKKILKE